MPNKRRAARDRDYFGARPSFIKLRMSLMTVEGLAFYYSSPVDGLLTKATTPLRMFSASTMQTNIQLLLLVLGTSVSLAAVDNTVVEKATGSAVVEAVVETIQQPCIFPDDALFMRRIAYAESRDGADASAFHDGSSDYYGGIWRIDEDMFDATQTDTTYHSDILAELGIDWLAVTWQDLWKPLHSGLAARLYIASMVASIPRSVDEQAVTWVTEYRRVSVTTSLTDQFIMAANETAIDCSVPKADIVFVLEASSSIGQRNHDLVKDFVARVVQTFNISQSKVRIGLVTYSSYAKVRFDLDRYSHVDDVVRAVRAVPYTEGDSNFAEALFAMGILFTQNGRVWDGVPQIGVFLTDGQSNDQAATITAAKQVHMDQLTVFSVGITSGAYLPELQEIGTDPDCIHVYLIDAFSNLIHFASQIQAETCKAPAVLVESTPVTGELTQDAIYYYKMPVEMIDDGATVTVDAMMGMVDVYLSWSVRNPSSAAYDFHTVASGKTVVSAPWDDAFTDDVRELYGTMIGLAPTSKYTLSYVGGGGDRMASASFILTAMAAVFVKALL